MTLKDSENATTSSCLGGQSTKILKWDPELLDKWLDIRTQTPEKGIRNARAHEVRQ